MAKISSISRRKACKIMREKKIRGRRLSKKQRGFFGAKCGISRGAGGAGAR